MNASVSPENLETRRNARQIPERGQNPGSKSERRRESTSCSRRSALGYRNSRRRSRERVLTKVRQLEPGELQADRGTDPGMLCKADRAGYKRHQICSGSGAQLCRDPEICSPGRGKGDASGDYSGTQEHSCSVCRGLCTRWSVSIDCVRSYGDCHGESGGRAEGNRLYSSVQGATGCCCRCRQWVLPSVSYVAENHSLLL